MKFYVINGPSINLLGIREPEIYGKESYQTLLDHLQKWGREEEIEIIEKQSNIEGELVSFIQEAYFQEIDGIIINPAAYTHTSIAILDALKAVSLPAVEVHISDVNTRESFRRISYIRDAVITTVSGQGIEGYHLAIKALKEYLLKKEERDDGKTNR